MSVVGLLGRGAKMCAEERMWCHFSAVYVCVCLERFVESLVVFKWLENSRDGIFICV